MKKNEQQAITAMAQAVSTLANLTADFAVDREGSRRPLLASVFRSKLKECDQNLRECFPESDEEGE